eukprot:354084-Chlamydomonas_euryale.AAC.11
MARCASLAVASWRSSAAFCSCAATSSPPTAANSSCRRTCMGAVLMPTDMHGRGGDANGHAWARC